jgi:hypothetical protein
MDDQLPNSHCSEIDRRLSELHFLVWLAQRKKEKRRLVIATLEALVGREFSGEKICTGIAWGVKWEGRATRKAPAQAELRPT